LFGEDLIAFRDTSGNVGLVAAACPHRRASLFWGRNEEEGLRCVYHGWKFDRSGQCVDMPSEPDLSNFKAKVSITAYPTTEHGGVIWAYLGSPERRPELPQFDWLTLPESHRHVTKRLEMTNWVQGLEGGLDSAHSNFLHANLDAYRRTPEWLEQAKTDGDVRLRYHATDSAPRFFAQDTDYGLRIGARRQADPDSHYWRFTHWLMPYYNLFSNGRERPGSNARGIMWVPIDEERTWVFSVTWNDERELTAQDVAGARAFSGEVVPGTYLPAANLSNDYLIDREMQQTTNFTGLVGVQVEDMAVQESMGAIVDRTLEHLGSSDTAIIKVRRRLIQGAIDATSGYAPAAAHDGSVYRVWSTEGVFPADGVMDEEAVAALCRLPATSP
jgi:phenylpropionate dioxygenase-like ring-hydroxylating dioxygenase large terminal subunit